MIMPNVLPHTVIVHAKTRRILAGAENTDQSHPALAAAVEQHPDHVVLLLDTLPENFRVGHVLPIDATRAVTHEGPTLVELVAERLEGGLDWARRNYLSHEFLRFRDAQGDTLPSGHVTEAYLYDAWTMMNLIALMLPANRSDDAKHATVQSNMLPWREFCLSVDTSRWRKQQVDGLSSGAVFQILREYDDGTRGWNYVTDSTVAPSVGTGALQRKETALGLLHGVPGRFDNPRP